MRLAFAFVLALAACGGPRSPAGSSIVIGNASSSAPDAAPVAQRTVCAIGDRSDPGDVKVEPCAEGLSCCYPCGIDGCDSVCMDVSQTGGCPEYP